MVVPFSQFGVNDYSTYLRYLALAEKQVDVIARYGGGFDLLVDAGGVYPRFLGSVAGGYRGVGQAKYDKADDVASARPVGAPGVDGARRRCGSCGSEFGGGGNNRTGDAGDKGCANGDDDGRKNAVVSTAGVLPQIGQYANTGGDASGDARASTGLGPNGGVSYGRGPNYERNLASRLKKKAAKRGGKFERAGCATASSERARVDGTFDTRPGFFSGADETVRKELVETRARRLIQENRVAEARAKAAAARIEKQMKAGFYEKCADAEINFVEGQLSGKYSLCVPRRVAGWAKTIATGESGSGTNSASSPKSKPESSPTLPKSSPSPSSSISQEEKRLSNLVTELEAKIVKLENDNKKMENDNKRMENKWRTCDRERKQFEKMYRGLATGISIQPPENIRYK